MLVPLLLTKEQAAWLNNKIFKAFLESDITQTEAFKTAYEVIDSLVVNQDSKFKKQEVKNVKY